MTSNEGEHSVRTHRLEAETEMDFDLIPGHRLFRDTIRSFVDRDIRPVARAWEREGRYPTEIVEGGVPGRV